MIFKSTYIVYATCHYYAVHVPSFAYNPPLLHFVINSLCTVYYLQIFIKTFLVPAPV